MIVLKNKLTGEKSVFSYQQYDSLPNHVDYEPIGAFGIVQLLKSNGQGIKSPDLITDKTTALNMMQREPEVYPEFDPFDTFALKADFAERTLSGQDYQNYMTELWKSADAD